MPNSIRFTLIGWFGLLLAAVLVVFGAILFAQARAATLGAIDDELTGRARAVAATLEWDEVDGWELELSEDYLRGLVAEAHYAVWDPDGSNFRTGGALAPDGPAPALGLQTRGVLREVTLAGPDGSRILVGRSIAPEQAELTTLLLRVVLAGAAVLALGLCVGWWLARRTLAPVESLAAAAAAVNERDLSRRLDEGSAPAELRDLASAFNATLERLEAAFRRQARFTADASHELRTPLAVIRTQAEQALRSARAPHDHREALAACLRASERMASLVEDLLTLARSEAADGELEREALALDEVVRECVDQLVPTAEAEGVALHCRVQPVQVVGNARLLGEVIGNLVTNAVSYNRRGGSVDVSLSQQDGRAVVTVTDTGIGIPAEAIDHVFERFYRVDAARARAHGGAGLGLAIAQRIAESHGGALRAHSLLDEGSTFTLELPLAPS